MPYSSEHPVLLHTLQWKEEKRNILSHCRGLNSSRCHFYNNNLCHLRILLGGSHGLDFFFQDRNPDKKEKCSEICPIFATWKKTEIFSAYCFYLPLTIWKWQILSWKWVGSWDTKKAKTDIPKACKKKPNRVQGHLCVCLCVKKKKRQDVSRISVISKSHPFFYVVTFTILTFLSLWMILVESKELQNQCYFFSF